MSDARQAMSDMSPGERSSTLRKLFEAIVAHDATEVSRLLTRQPELARLATEVGATRATATEHYFEKIEHYVYAGDTALHVAAAAYAPRIAETLLAAEANVHAKNRRGAEALHYAADGIPGAAHWNPDAQKAVIDVLIAAGAEPNAADKTGVTPLHRAVRTRCAAAVRALLRGGADARVKNKNGSTALQLAMQNSGRGGTGSPLAREQQAEIIELLRRAG